MTVTSEAIAGSAAAMARASSESLARFFGMDIKASPMSFRHEKLKNLYQAKLQWAARLRDLLITIEVIRITKLSGQVF
jgi:hypothetical protein